MLQVIEHSQVAGCHSYIRMFWSEHCFIQIKELAAVVLCLRIVSLAVKGFSQAFVGHCFSGIQRLKTLSLSKRCDPHRLSFLESTLLQSLFACCSISLPIAH